MGECEKLVQGEPATYTCHDLLIGGSELKCTDVLPLTQTSEAKKLHYKWAKLDSFYSKYLDWIPEDRKEEFTTIWTRSIPLRTALAANTVAAGIFGANKCPVLLKKMFDTKVRPLGVTLDARIELLMTSAIAALKPAAAASSAPDSASPAAAPAAGDAASSAS